MTAEELVLSLTEDGYTLVDEYKALRAGRRVRNAGEQYPGAIDRGTAVVFAVLRREGSRWEKVYRMDDVEVVVIRDDGTVGHWANYGTALASTEVAA